MGFDLIEIKQNNYGIIKDIDKSMTDQLIQRFFMQSANGQIFIKRTGLLYKFNKAFDARDVSVEFEMPTKEEIEASKMIYGLSENDVCAVAKCKMTFVEAGAVYQESAICYSGNLNKATLNNAYEMAKTRAHNRLLRIITGFGFTSLEEIDETVTEDREVQKPTPVKQTKPVQKVKPETLKQANIEVIDENPNYTTQMDTLKKLVNANNNVITFDTVKNISFQLFKTEVSKELTEDQFDDLIKQVETYVKTATLNENSIMNEPDVPEDFDMRVQMIKDLVSYANEKGISRAELEKKAENKFRKSLDILYEKEIKNLMESMIESLYVVLIIIAIPIFLAVLIGLLEN